MISRHHLLTAVGLFLAISLGYSLRLSHPELHADEITYMNAVFESSLQDRLFPVQGDGSLFLNKPPLSFWAMRISFEILGPSPFAARLPSVLFAAATSALLFLYGTALWGRLAGLLAALVFALTPSPLVAHGLRAATPDSLEILLLTIAIGALETYRRRRAGWALVGTVTAVAATAWVKSPFAALVFIAYWLGSELFARRAGRGTPRFWLSLGLVVVTWAASFGLWLAVLAADTSPRAVSRRLLNQQYGRRIEGRLTRSHVQGPSFYPRSLARDFGPFLLLPLAAGGLALGRRRGISRENAADAAGLVGWTLAAPLLASASASKLTWYAYLSHPGLALLVAVSGRHLLDRLPRHRWLPVAILTAGTVLLAVRLPLADGWPAEPRFRGPAGRLWQLAQDDPTIAVEKRPETRLPRQSDTAYREARFYLRTLLHREPTGSPCRVVLENAPIASPAPQLELYRPTGNDEDDVGLWLVDECGGRMVALLKQTPPGRPSTPAPGR